MRIPDEPRATPSVSELFPWVLAVLAMALGAAMVLSYLDKRRVSRDRE